MAGVAGLPKGQAGLFIGDQLNSYENTTVMSMRAGRSGQVTLEYFIIFAAVAAVTIVGLTAFGSNIRTALGGFFNAAATRIAN